MRDLWQELSHAWRLIRRTRASSLAVVAIISLGVGVITALFSILQAVVFRPLPYTEPDRLVVVGASRLSGGDEGLRYVLAGPEIDAIQTLSVFEAVAVAELWNYTVKSRPVALEGEFAARLRAGRVTPNFFEALGVRAARGRVFQAGDVPRDEVVISHEFWTREFGGEAEAVGASLALDGRPHTVIGVLPPGLRFSYPDETEVWAIRPTPVFTYGFAYLVVARLGPGVSLPKANAALTSLASPLPGRDRRAGPAFVAEPLQSWTTRGAIPGLTLLAGAGGLIFLIVCANASLLLLARATLRTHDAAIRLALGASQRRRFRELAIEHGLLGLAGTIGGVVMATLAHPFMRTAVPRTVPRIDELGLDGPTLLVASAVGVCCALGSGLVTFVASDPTRISRALAQDSATATSSRQRLGWRRTMLTAQMSTLVALLIAAGLLLHSFWRVSRVDPGFDTTNIAVIQMGLDVVPGDPDWEQRAVEFSEQVRERIAALPGVAVAAVSGTVPFEGIHNRTLGLRHGTLTFDRPRVDVYVRRVGPDFFRVFNMRLLAGRTFNPADTRTAPRVAIVSQALGRALFGENPIGRHLQWDEGYEIVGVVEDVRWVHPERPAAPAFYLPFAQNPAGVVSVVARTRSRPTGFASAAQRAVQSIAPNQPVELNSTLDTIMAKVRAERRFYAVTTAAFGLLGLVLAALGVYGAVDVGVTERLRELAVRVALGADAQDIGGVVLRQAVVPALSGVFVGGLGGLWAGRLLARFLFEVHPVDPLTFTVVPALLVLVAVLSALPSVWRALKIDPAALLRQQ